MTRATPKLVLLRKHNIFSALIQEFIRYTGSLWFGSISVVSISLTPFFTLVSYFWSILCEVNLKDFSDPAEVQTFSMRSKGLLIWNTVSQLEGAYVTWVDAIALDSIGYKYYAVYMPLVIIQWFLVYFCEWFILYSINNVLTALGRHG